MDLSANTQTILLLTAPLIVGRGKPATRPLSPGEYSKLAVQLSEHGLEPSNLLQNDFGGVLNDSQIGFDGDRIKALLHRGLLLSQALENWQSRSIWVISRADYDYPEHYKRMPGQHRPPILYGCGNKSLLQNGGLAVVGSRKISEELVEYAESVGRLAANALSTIISGGAPGVDQASVHGALSGGGTATVVLPGELEKAVMSRLNRDMLMDGRLALISPFDPRARWSVGQAMGRNKLIYGLSNAALVVESSYNEGGTWPGAVEQLDKLHFVPVYTRSAGSPSKGLDGLRDRGALEWTEPQNIEDFRAVLKSKISVRQAKVVEQPPLALDDSEISEAFEGGGGDHVAQPETGPRDRAVESKHPSDILLATADKLLATIDKPITVSNVAQYLGVNKKQAGDWLKLLEESGVFHRKTKRAPYERVALFDGCSTK